jgi:hypothetical protein
MDRRWQEARAPYRSSSKAALWAIAVLTAQRSAFTRKEEQATTIGSACARHLGVNDSHYTCMRELGRRGSRDRQRPAQH